MVDCIRFADLQSYKNQKVEPRRNKIGKGGLPNCLFNIDYQYRHIIYKKKKKIETFITMD